MGHYHSRLVVKGYAQKEGIDFNEIFSPVVKLTTIRVVLTMCVAFDLHLEFIEKLKKKYICSNWMALKNKEKKT